ncbi:hypothetical protein GETHLI_11700 [Geothrix limicola]|uniref:Uncharacterized protein n=1 Tax=Geothrix limicola TaxID=2927978 RepID=A0ABQ5QDC2_9BACT|nr:hypothetical protein [Geothrix limicola]GLH72668.1 hypothetical protein GETHLI_11700 [Geothrix limicola]
MKIASCALIFALNIYAETPTNPVHADTAVICPIVADATFHVKKMNLNFTQLSYLNVDGNSANVNNLANTAVAGLGFNEPKYKDILSQVWNNNYAGVVAYIQWYVVTQAVTGALTGIANNLASYNTQYRYFTFFVPVDGRYTISVSLPGDPIIRPKNTLRLVSGNYNWSWIENLGGNTSKTFVFENLAAGPYIIEVGLGSTSTIFHSAGDLTQVQLDSSTERSWVNKVIIKSDSFDVRTQLPTIGSTKQFAFPFLPVPVNTNVLDGRVEYTNFEARHAFLNSTYNDIWTQKVGGLCRWVEFPMASETVEPFLSGGQAFYSFKRDANEYEKICGEQ